MSNPLSIFDGFSICKWHILLIFKAGIKLEYNLREDELMTFVLEGSKYVSFKSYL